MVRTLTRVFVAAMVVSLTAAAAMAQTTTTTSTQAKKFEVIAVNGNDLVVRLPEGTKEMTVADDFRFNVDGQQLSVKDLKPGMKGTATITTKTTVIPVTVTEIKSGTVMQASGGSILVRTDQGFKNFTQGDVDKRGVKIIRNGEPAQISDFHSGDQLTATIITSHPPKVLTEKQVNATIAKANPSAAPAAGAGATPSRAASSPAAAPAEHAATSGSSAKKLPKTGSSWPLVGLVSALSLAMGFALTIRRRANG